MRQSIRLYAAVAMLMIILFSCRNDDDEVISLEPTITPPNDTTLSINTTATLSFSIEFLGEITAASVSSSNESVAKVEIITDLTAVNSGSDLDVLVNGLSKGETVVTLEIGYGEGQNASSNVRVIFEEKVTDAIGSRDDLSSLAGLVDNTGLNTSLNSNGPYTVFAPDNAALEALLVDQEVSTIEELISKKGATDLGNILQSHVVAGSITFAEMLDKEVYVTLGGATLTISDDGEEKLVNNASFIESDIVFDDGIIHIIDSVVNLSAVSDGTNGFTVTIENVSEDPRFFQHSVFNVPVGSSESGPILPEPQSAEGGTYEFSFYAGPVIASNDTTRLSMIAKLNAGFDLFFATSPNGLKLYNDNNVPITGDITNQITLWDAGTKDNATGEDEIESIAVRAYDGDQFPAVSDLIRVTISNDEELFTVRVQNISGTTTSPIPVSPGVYGIHSASTPFFSTTRSAGTDGLKELAELGDPAPLDATMSLNEGVFVPLSPGVFAVHNSDVRPVLVTGTVDRGQGLESLAEDGDNQQLGSFLSQDSQLKTSGAFSIPLQANEPGNLGPGQRYSFSLENTLPGDHITIVLKMMQSNDIIYSTPENGIPLFLENGRPFSGNASKLMVTYDVGTEQNEYPGAGLSQPLRQLAPNSGEPDPDNTIRRVTTNDIDPSEDGFIYRPIGERIKVTITPNP
ncbi:MAG: spondin domain-containing protein [Bacteroidota bacterium]